MLVNFLGRDRLLFLLVPILTQPFLPFVGRHFMPLPLLSAWHGCIYFWGYTLCVNELLHVVLNLVHKRFGRFERGNEVLGDNNGGVFRDVTCGFLGAFLNNEAAEAA